MSYKFDKIFLARYFALYFNEYISDITFAFAFIIKIESRNWSDSGRPDMY